MNAAVDVTRLCRRLIPILLVCCLAPAVTLAEEGRKVVFRLLCLEHREGITSARVDVGVKPGKFHEIILLTGNAGPSAEAAAYSAGVDLFMEKPFSIRSLHEGVLKVLGHQGAPEVSPSQ